MEEKQNEILRTNKIEIFYHIESGEFMGAGFLDGIKVNDKLSNKVEDLEKLKHIGSLINKQKSSQIEKIYTKKEEKQILSEVSSLIESIVVNFTDWQDFIKNGYNIIKVINGELIGEIILPTLEQLKASAIKKRVSYLNNTGNMYSHNWSLATQEVITKRNLALQQLIEIENATEDTIDNYLIEFI